MRERPAVVCEQIIQSAERYNVRGRRDSFIPWNFTWRRRRELIMNLPIARENITIIAFYKGSVRSRSRNRKRRAEFNKVSAPNRKGMMGKGIRANDIFGLVRCVLAYLLVILSRFQEAFKTITLGNDYILFNKANDGIQQQFYIYWS